MIRWQHVGLSWHMLRGAEVIWRTILLLLTCAAAVELRGMSSNIAKHRPATQSSLCGVEQADCSAGLAVDGNYGQHMFYNGCAMTAIQDEPWWRVDLGNRVPLLIVRMFARNDDTENVAFEGLEIRVGDNDDLKTSEPCATGARMYLRGPTVVNCLGQGRYVFIWLPNVRQKRLALCEVGIMPRGPEEVHEWWGTTGSYFDIDVKGKSMHNLDRIRIIPHIHTCGTDAAINMHPDVVVRSAPSGPRSSGSDELDVWKDVKVLVRGFYKVCWCTGLGVGCETGRDFNFVAGYLIITGEVRTVVGDGQDLSLMGPKADPEPDDMGEVRIGWVSGLTFRERDTALLYSEPHRVRRVSLTTGKVTTLIGSRSPGAQNGNGTVARLNSPAGLDSCDEGPEDKRRLLIADAGNNLIRALSWKTGIVTTVAGSGNKGFFGDGGHPHNASLNNPHGVSCDYWRNGIWIADTDNNAIRGIFPNNNAQEFITTSAGNLGEGLASEGGWSKRSMVKAPKQISMSSAPSRPDITLIFAEAGNSVARFIPMTSLATVGNMQTVVGTGTTGWLLRTVDGYRVVDMNATEGIVAHDSIAYVSDTLNHRIWMVPFLEYRGLGCYKDDGTLLPSLEGVTQAGLPAEEAQRDIRTGLSTRANAVKECAAAALRMGWDVFGVRDGGKCGSHKLARQRYRAIGAGDRNCLNGIGSPDSNDVYELLPGMTPDLYGKNYAIAGRAFTTAINVHSEKPRPGFFGDGLSSWITSVDQPGQLAIDKETNNLFFADKGNYRIRVIFGSFGPRPYNQVFRCLNGLNCSLGITGNALTQFDKIAFLRKAGGADVVCGNDEFDLQFPQVAKGADRDTVFLRKNYTLGRITLLTVGDFQICYCVYDGGRHCNKDPMFDFVAGTLQVYGPNVLQHLTVVAGVPFDLEVFGLELSSNDRLMLISASGECGTARDEIAADRIYYSKQPDISLPPTVVSPTREAWRGMVIKRSIELAVCWCNRGYDCVNNTNFTVRTIELHVTGPTVANYSVTTGSAFNLMLRGTGGFKVTDRVRLQPAGTLCEANSTAPNPGLDAILPWYAVPCSMSATTVQWCDVVVSNSSDLLVCWCGSTEGCTQKEDFNVLGARLSVTGNNVLGAVSGPFYQAVTPVPPLSVFSVWPATYIADMERAVTVRAQTRKGVLGASSVGPIDVFVCENPKKCMGPARLFNLQPGLEAQADFVSSLLDIPLRPRAILVRSRSRDTWLAESVDVRVNFQWRRFPLNRWFATFSGMGDGRLSFPWADDMPPPRALSPVEEFYSSGDSCGGCPLGLECHALNATHGNCVALCGDGMLVMDEQCDDGNLQSLDGCNSRCRVEDGFECKTEHGSKASVCRPQTCPGNVGLDQYAAICGTSGMDIDTSTDKTVSCWLKDAQFCRSPVLGSWLPYLSSASLVCPSCDSWMTDESWLCAKTEAHPKAVFATTIDDGRGLMVAFDVPVNTTMEPGNLSRCEEIFNSTTTVLFGDLATCQWASSRHAVVQFGFGAKFGMPGHEPPSVDILDEARQHVNVTVPILESWKFPSQKLMLPSLNDADTPEVPVVILRAPPLVGTCGNLTIDAIASRGSMGRPWSRASWSCLGPNCDDIAAYFPDECPGASLNAALDQGAQPCDLLVTLPEDLATTLAAQNTLVQISLELENVAGMSSTGHYALRFTSKRVPVVIALSDPTINVAPTAHFSLEVAARAALPASTQSPCSFEEPLGPLEISWRVADFDPDNTDVAAQFEDLMQPPATMSTTATVGVLSGVLGPLASPGSTWQFVVRVRHIESSASRAAAVFLTFNVAVANITAATVSLKAPEKVSSGCPFQAVSTVHGPLHADATFKWKCTRTDFLPGTPPGYMACDSAAKAETSSVLSLSVLPAGVYRLEVMYGHQESELERAHAEALVVVTSDGGPKVTILEPAETVSKTLSDERPDETILFRATVDGLNYSSCAPSSVSGAVMLVGLAPHTPAPIVVDMRVLSADLQFGASTPSGSVIAAVPLAELVFGAKYRFQLLLTGIPGSLSTYVKLVSSGDPLAMPSSSQVPLGIWSHESAVVTRALPTLFEAWIEPRSGVAARTLFLLQVRALRDGCEFSFRFAWAQEGVSIDSCDIAISDWQLLRSWSSYPEARMPFLAGHFVVETRVRSADGSIARKCAVIDVSSTGPNQALADETDAQAAAGLIANWVADVSPAINVIRSSGQAEALVLALHAAAFEFPDMIDFIARFGSGATTTIAPLLRKLYDNMCSTLAETVWSLGGSVFAPPGASSTAGGRRVSGASNSPSLHIEAAVNSLFRTTHGLEPLLTLAQLNGTVTVLQALLGRNAAVRGLLGSPGLGTPTPVAPDFLGAADIVVRVANQTSSSGAFSAVVIVSATVQAVRQLGDVVAAALRLNAPGPPVKIQASQGKLQLSVRHLSGTAVRLQGISLDLPSQTIEVAAYPGVSIPAVADWASLKGNISRNANSNGSSPFGTCLGRGNNAPMDAIALVIIFWHQDIYGIGRIGGAAPDGINVTSVYDVAMRTCGMPITLGRNNLNDGAAAFDFELLPELTVGRRAGYGSLDPFRCVQWTIGSGSDTGLWLDDGCRPIFRAKGETSGAEGLMEGAVRCVCDTMRPTTWGIEVVPRPPFVEPPPDKNKSFINLVLFGCIFVWVFGLLLLCWAGLGDVGLDLGRDDVAERIAGTLTSMPESGASGAALASLASLPWPIRSGLTQQVLALQILLSELCRGRSTGKRSLEVTELRWLRQERPSAPISKSRVAPDPYPQSMITAPEETLPIQDANQQGQKSAARQLQIEGNQEAITSDGQLQVRQQEEPPRVQKAAAAPAATSAFRAAAARTAVDKEKTTAQTIPANNYALEDFAEAEREAKPTREEILGFMNRPMDDATAAPRGEAAADWDARVRGEIAQRNRELAEPMPRGIEAELPYAYQVEAAQGRPQAPNPELLALPEGWTAQYSSSHGGTYYVNLFNGKSTWARPQLPAVTVLSTTEIKQLLGSAADGVNLRKELEDKLRARLAERGESAAREDDDDIWGAGATEVSSGGAGAAARSVSPRLRGKNLNDVSPDGRALAAATRDIPLIKLQPEYQHQAAPPEVDPAAWTLPPGMVESPLASSIPSASAQLMPGRPVPLLMPEASHGMAPNQLALASNGNGNYTGGLRQTAQAGNTAQIVVADHATKVSQALGGYAQASEPRSGMPLRLEFADWGYCYLVWQRWVRNFPITSLATPRLMVSRFSRAAAYVLWLNASLLVGIAVASASSWGDKLSEDVDASNRSTGDLFSDLGTAFGLPITVPLGLGCHVVAAWLTALASSPGPAAPQGSGKIWLKSWWLSARRRTMINAVIMLLVAVAFTGGAIVVAAISPQPRAAVALAAFLIALALNLVLAPIVSALAGALALRWLATRSSTRCEILLTQRPSLMDFTHVQVSRWRSRNQLLDHIEALAAERQACLEDQKTARLK